MSSVIIRDMEADDEYFIITCSHVDESEEIDRCGEKRRIWFKKMYRQGLRAKAALIDNSQVGFLYVMPIEICPWGPRGRDLMVIPCLYVLNRFVGKKVGRALLDTAGSETRQQRKKGLVAIAYYHDFWFMPATYFEVHGFAPIRRRKTEALLWKVYDPSARPPEFLQSQYRFQPVPGKVVIDLFWNLFCQTSTIEAERVREIVVEFGDDVILNEYPADNRDIFGKYQLARGIFINGKEVYWGYEAPRDGLRKAVEKALAETHNY
jgi:hypothetical protein